METLVLIASLTSLIAVVLIAILFWSQLKKSRELLAQPKDEQSFLMMQQQIQEMSKVLDVKLSQTHQTMQMQFGQSAKIITAVTEKLTKLDETNKQVMGFADQLQSLENILKNPKHRGVLGEYYLETVLKNVLPPAGYKMQYGFANGDVVDAVIFIGDKILPIDSKFSLENYNRLAQEKDEHRHEDLEKQFKLDLKKRIDETAKYIRPEEGTMDFAFMFIPAEGIFYDLLVSQVGAVKVNTRDLIEYAFGKRVIIVAPTSFFAYLQTVLQGLRALKIEESAKEIRVRVEQLAKHLNSYDAYLKKLGGHLGTTVNTYNQAYKEFGKVDKDVIKITGQPSGLVIEQARRPELED